MDVVCLNDSTYAAIGVKYSFQVIRRTKELDINGAFFGLWETQYPRPRDFQNFETPPISEKIRLRLVLTLNGLLKLTNTFFKPVGTRRRWRARAMSREKLHLGLYECQNVRRTLLEGAPAESQRKTNFEEQKIPSHCTCWQ